MSKGPLDITPELFNDVFSEKFMLISKKDYELIRYLICKYFENSSTCCYSDREMCWEIQGKLAKLFEIPLYDDGSGVDYGLVVEEFEEKYE